MRGKKKGWTITSVFKLIILQSNKISYSRIYHIMMDWTIKGIDSDEDDWPAE